MSATSIAYRGPWDERERVVSALRRVVDPEMALNIVDLGLVYGVDLDADAVRVRLTMTSAACPVAEMIVDDVVAQLGRSLGPDVQVQPELVWDPPWGPERMSAAARSAMGWD